MQRDRVPLRWQVTSLICIACVTFVLSCSPDPELPELVNPQGFSLAVPGGSLRLQLLDQDTRLIARREMSLKFRILEGIGAAPDSLELVGDMPSMSHGPSRWLLHRTEGFYRGEIVFVMGGEWVVDFQSASKSLGQLRCYVHER